MKPMNFPGRVNKRRQEAIDRLSAIPEPRKGVAKIIIDTSAKIIDQGEAEACQTKIRREKR